MTNKTVILHIGTHKTGTTALQKFFHLNRKQLRARGIVYPYDRGGGAEGGHFRLYWSLLKLRSRDMERFPRDLGTPEKEWQAALNACRGACGLLSAEGLWITRPQDIEHIGRLLAGRPVQVVVYLRRQDTLSNSIYNEIIKGGRIPDHSISYKMDYDQALRPWAQVFGRDNIIVRPYENGQFYGQSIFADFLHHSFGCELTREFRIPCKAVNPSLHRIALAYKRTLNSLPLKPAKKAAFFEPLLDVSQVLIRSGRRDYPPFSPSDQLAFCRQYADANRRVAQEYLGRPELFLDPMPDAAAPWQPYDELTAEDAQLINTLLARRHPGLVGSLLFTLQDVFTCGDDEARAAGERLLPGLVDRRPCASEEELRQAVRRVCTSYRLPMTVDRAKTIMVNLLRSPLKTSWKATRSLGRIAVRPLRPAARPKQHPEREHAEKIS